MIDIATLFSGRLVLSPAGDLQSVTGVLLSNQRVLRRLLTPPGTYIFHREYGAGLQQLIGQPIDGQAIATIIIGQMYQESSVGHQPQPVVTVVKDDVGTVYVTIAYVVMPLAVPSSIGFNLGPSGVSNLTANGVSY